MLLCARFNGLFSRYRIMHKQKTHKGIKKRFKVTASGKLRYKHPSGNHLMNSKNSKKRKRIAGPAIMTGVYADKIKAMSGK
jgi:large subunit ribosomal protein L35